MAAPPKPAAPPPKGKAKGAPKVPAKGHAAAAPAAPACPAAGNATMRGRACLRIPLEAVVLGGGPLDATLPLTAMAAPHDSAFLCVRPAVGGRGGRVG